MILGIHGKLGTPKSVEEYQQKLAPLTKQDVQHYLEYTLQFWIMLETINHLETKIYPRLEPETFDKLIKIVDDAKVSELYSKVKEALFSTEKGLLGYAEAGHLSNYYLTVKL